VNHLVHFDNSIVSKTGEYGVGGEQQRTDSGLLPLEEARILARGIKEGWIVAPWPLSATRAELDQAKESRGLTLEEQAVESTMTGLSKQRGSCIHVRNVLAMKAQNMELAGVSKPQETVQHEHRHAVMIVEDEKWYGNKAHAHAAEAASSSIADHPVTSPMESSGLRAPMGQNGHGPTNGHSGPRPGEGSQEGGG
jgi:hypothetical protein